MTARHECKNLGKRGRKHLKTLIFGAILASILGIGGRQSSRARTLAHELARLMSNLLSWSAKCLGHNLEQRGLRFMSGAASIPRPPARG